MSRRGWLVGSPPFTAAALGLSRRFFAGSTNPLGAFLSVEPHYQLPLFQFLPRGARMSLNRRFSLGWQGKGHWEEITLLSA
ncbi:MAG TPA: hypothetical protein VNP89_04060, partial [Gaiellaceae bacterium]|nr:hypothetical protein [Gaiellaceae bacterium]